MLCKCTYNNSHKIKSKKCILFYLPYQETLSNFTPIKILLDTPCCKEVQYDSDAKKESCFDKWFVATTVSCNTWYKIFNLPHNIQGQRKQYGIQHYIAVAINSDMGDTLPSVATSLSMADNNYSIRDKGNILVILARTKLAKDTTFVGNKESNLNALSRLLKNGHNGHNIWMIYWR